MSKRISELGELLDPANEDIIEVVDNSEINIDNKNKRLKLETLRTMLAGGILDNPDATAAPTITDDSSLGYSKLSRWLYDGTLYTCFDATVGAAIWKGFVSDTSF